MIQLSFTEITVLEKRLQNGKNRKTSEGIAMI